MVNKREPLYAVPQAEAIAFVKTNYTDDNDDWPDVHLMFDNFGENADGGVMSKRFSGLDDDFYASEHTL